MRSIVAVVVAIFVTGSGVPLNAADAKLSDDIDGGPSDKHTFSLLPKAFQKNPELEMTGFTVMTDYGRTVPPPSPSSPIYYEIHDSGKQLRGDIASDYETPPPAVLSDTLQRSLSAAGYLPAKGGHKPGLMLIYFWGAHDRMDRDMAEKFPERARQYIMERALLVGGKDYAHKLEEELNRPSLVIDKTLKHDFLRDQALEDMYYVVVSAYNYDEVMHHQHRLLWRTTMTVNSRGISMSQGMPALIVMGKDFYGQETKQPMALRRDVHSGTIKLGPLNILETGVSTHANAAQH